MEQLQACIDDLMDGRGGIVSITGEAGIGKTRLVSELKQYAGDKVRWLEGRCISYGQAMNYGPFRGIISSYLGILPTDTEEEMKAKLQEKVNGLLPEQHRWGPIHVGNLFFPEYEAELLTASGDDYAKQYTYPILRNMFHRIADEKPLVMVFEDLHWSDPTSLAVLEFLMQSVDEAAILYVWVYRPYRDSGCWMLRQRADQEFGYCNTQLDLMPLQSEDTDALVSELLHIPDIPENMRTLVQNRASGNPLYVEEIIRSFIDEEAVIRDADYWRATIESAHIVPSDTLQGVILERVDKLSSEDKEVLQIASVLGDSFPLILLEQVIESDSRSASLRALERAQMLQRKRVGQEWEYGFFHPLIHDVVYHSLLPEDRAALHEKAGSAIESIHSDHLDDYTDILAHHYSQSSDIDKALYYLTLAGDKALKIKSYWEALECYGKAMEKAEGLSDDQRKKQVIVDLVTKRATPRHYLGALRADIDEHEKYLQWAEELGDKEIVTSFYLYLAGHSCFMGDIARLEKYDPLLAAARGLPEPEGYYQAILYFYSDNLEEMARYAEEMARKAKSTGRLENVPQWIIIMSMRLARVYGLMGQWEKSLQLCQSGLDKASEVSQRTSIIYAHNGMGNAYLDMGEYERAIAEYETALELSPSGNAIPWIVPPLGCAYCRSGSLDKGIDLLRRGLKHYRSIGETGALVECEYCLPLAEGYLAKGDMDNAQKNTYNALHIALEQGYIIYEAQAYRILGEILAQTDFPSAEDHFSRSLKIMQRIKARNEEGKTELSWGRVCQQHGDMDQARAHLTRAAEIFEQLGTDRYLEWTKEAMESLS
jgi:tetratricopeptide (TPR) repeat protein